MTGDVCRKHGVSSATFYKWKAKYGGSICPRRAGWKVLTDENVRLKKLFPEAMLGCSTVSGAGITFRMMS
jgi:putative transposase